MFISSAWTKCGRKADEMRTNADEMLLSRRTSLRHQICPSAQIHTSWSYYSAISSVFKMCGQSDKDQSIWCELVIQSEGPE